jgi:hypothetical protein
MEQLHNIHEMPFKHQHVPIGLRIAAFTLLGVTMASLFALAFGWLVMLLWNKLMPSLFGLPLVNYWQSVGLVVLTKLLFGGFGPHHGRSNKAHHSHFKKHFFSCNNDPVFPNVNHENGKYFHEYWKEEGRKAFDLYLEKRKSTEENIEI